MAPFAAGTRFLKARWPSAWPTFFVVIVCGGTACCAVAGWCDDRDEGSAGKLLAPGQLPEPPEELARWLKSAGVTFRVGGAPPAAEASAGERSDSRLPAEPEPSAEAERRSEAANRVDALTRYRVAYDYETRSRWRLEGRGQNRQLVVTIRFRNVQWRPSHVIWFRQSPAVKSFWNHPLVRHEFDHVRLSGDRRWRDRFVAMLDEQRVLRIPLAADERIDHERVRRAVDRHVQTVFGKIVELIDIRYRELDRLTGHGTRPLPPDSELAGGLRRSAVIESER